MTTDPGPDNSTGLSPDETFEILGKKVRLQILQTLGEAGEPLAYSELFDRIEYDDSSNFNYHLGRLESHFIHRTDDGYTLRHTGRRVIEAVLSGAVIESPVVERTPIDWPCFLCGAPIEVSYQEEHLGMYCPSCGGTRGAGSTTGEEWAVQPTDVLGYLDLPPAGINDRTPKEILEAASVWTTTNAMGLSRGICPRCSASLKQSVAVCNDHDNADGRCESCDQRFGITVHHQCTNCIFDRESPFVTSLSANMDLIEFMIEHGIDPLAHNGFHLSSLDERIVSTDPFKAHYRFAADGDVLTLTVNNELSVVDATHSNPTETG